MYDPNVWGPVFWSFLDIIALHYPSHPNDIIKKKYYHFIQNLPVFIPDYQIANDFQEMLNTYPIRPYLENKKSLIKWVHFIHNQINKKLNKPIVAIDVYHKKFQQKPKKKYPYFIILILVSAIIYYYKK